MSWSRHLMNLLYPGIFSTPVHSSFTGRLEMSAAMVACRLWIYSLTSHSPATSRSYSNGDHSHPPYPAFRAVFPAIILSTWWWKNSRTFNFYPVTTHLSLLYINTVWTKSLYTITLVSTTAPEFVITFTNINDLSVQCFLEPLHGHADKVNLIMAYSTNCMILSYFIVIWICQI